MPEHSPAITDGTARLKRASTCPGLVSVVVSVGFTFRCGLVRERAMSYTYRTLINTGFCA
jgi:hypothetical protein